MPPGLGNQDTPPQEEDTGHTKPVWPPKPGKLGKCTENDLIPRIRACGGRENVRLTIKRGRRPAKSKGTYDKQTLILVCDHGGVCRACIGEDEQKGLLSTKKLDCPFCITLVAYVPRGHKYHADRAYDWAVVTPTEEESQHNHDTDRNLAIEVDEVANDPSKVSVFNAVGKASSIQLSPSSSHDQTVLKAAFRKFKAKSNAEMREEKVKYGTAGAVIRKLLSFGAYVTYHTCAGGLVSRIFFTFPTNIALLRHYHYVLYVDATYQTNKEGYRLFNIVSSAADKRTFVVAQAYLNDETRDAVTWVMEQLRELFDAIGLPEHEDIAVAEDHAILRELGIDNSDAPHGDGPRDDVDLSSLSWDAITALLAGDSTVIHCAQAASQSMPSSVSRVRITIPAVICCDRSAMNIHAIITIFPGSELRLCVWHAWENIVGYTAGIKQDVRHHTLSLCNDMLSAHSHADASRAYNSALRVLYANGYSSAYDKMVKLAPYLPYICEFTQKSGNMRARTTSPVESSNAAQKHAIIQRGNTNGLLSVSPSSITMVVE